MNLAGAQIVGRAESFLVYGKLAILLLFCVAGLAFVDGSRFSPPTILLSGDRLRRCIDLLGVRGF
ncbi:amino acid transporter PotE domain protein [Mycobacterium ulcerans str. Harvey]|uniref:Amino acid transporter PotE domain protein n=1 Tax=Mycobacterium ulcerans str. Harvey TaxID=1299332 RepID=A0ABN0QUV4_MYCUL|nr:amino acid transporter PotE domain protein [Mycobacterium ulcerans str. Harvey]